MFSPKILENRYSILEYQIQSHIVKKFLETLDRIYLFGYANFNMRTKKIKVSRLRLQDPEGTKNSKVFTTEVISEPLLGIGDSNSGWSLGTVKFNHLTTFYPQNTVFEHRCIGSAYGVSLIDNLFVYEKFPKSTGKSFCDNLPESIRNFHAVGKCEYTHTNFTNQYANQYVREAHREYKNGNKKIVLHLIEGTPALDHLNTFNNIVSIETTNTIVKKTKFQGFKSLVHYDKLEKSGDVIIVLNEQKPRVLLINYKNVLMEEIVDIVKHEINLGKFK